MGVAPLAVGDRTIDRVDVGGPYATTACRVEADPFALEVPAGVVAERTWQQAGAGQDLEAVADADHGSGGRDEGTQRVADAVLELQREHPAGAQCVRIAEAAGNNHHLCRVEQRQTLDQFGHKRQTWLRAGEVEGEGHIAIAVGARGSDDESGRSAHRCAPPKASISLSSEMGLRPGRVSVGSSTTMPRTATGSPSWSASHSTSAAATSHTNRLADSLNNAETASGAGRSLIDNPRRPAMAISASATARPPSLMSWHAAMRPVRIAACSRR